MFRQTSLVVVSSLVLFAGPSLAEVEISQLANASATEEEAVSTLESIASERLAAGSPVTFVAPFWSLHGRRESRLILLNSFSQPIVADVVLYSKSGAQFPLGSFQLEPNRHEAISLREAIARSGKKAFAQGTLRVSFEGDAEMLQAWILLEQGAQALELPLVPPGSPQDTQLLGFWDLEALRRSRDLSVTYYVTNISDTPITFSAELQPDPENPQVVEGRLAPGEQKAVEIDARPGQRARGRIDLKHSGQAGDLVACGLLSGEAVLAGLPLMPPSDVKSFKEYQAIRVPLWQAKAGGGSHFYETILSLYNASETRQAVTLSLVGPDGGERRAEEATLEPHEIRTLDVLSLARVVFPVLPSEIRAVLRSDEPAFMLKLMSYHPENGPFEVTFQPAEKAHQNGTYPLLNLAEYDVFATLINLGAEPARVLGQLSWRDGTYSLGPLLIAPGQARTIDIGSLAAGQQPDLLARTLPVDYENGYFQWTAQVGNHRLLGRVEARRHGAFDTVGFNCYGCCAEASYGDILPSSATFAAGSSTGFQAVEWVSTCSGTMGPYPPYNPSYSVAPPFAWNGAQISSPNPATGTATFQAVGERILPVSCEATQIQIGDSGPVKAPRVSFAGVSLGTNQINVQLSPAGVGGTLRVYLNNPNTRTIQSTSYFDGGQTLFLTFGDFNTYPTGHEYNEVVAEWTVEGFLLTARYPDHFRVLGIYRHSQYTVPKQSNCPGGPLVAAYLYSSSCVLTNGSLNDVFRARTVINGTGLSDSYGYITNEEFCTGAGTAFYNRFRHSVPAPMGHLDGYTGGLSSSTVAVNDDHPYLNFSDRVLIPGLGVKVVTDRLGVQNHFQLDHFNESGACTLTDIGNLQTLKIW